MFFSYQKLWLLLKERHIGSIGLQDLAHISARTISKLANNDVVKKEVLEKVAAGLNVAMEDIFEVSDTFIPPEENPLTLAKKQYKDYVSSVKQLDLFNDDTPVDEPMPNTSFDFIDLFAGIGGIRIGYESVGGRCVFSSEWDSEAAKTYEANFGEKPYGDITKLNPKELPDFDILLAGFPCQPFSIIGAKEGFNHETQGTLFFNIEEILKIKQPKAFMLENVRNLTAHDKGRTFKIIIKHLTNAGYFVHYKVLNALDYGVPQKRERIIIVGFKKDIEFSFPLPLPENKRAHIKDILESDDCVDPKLFVREEIRKSRLARLKCHDYPRPYISHENVSGTITPHTYSCALRAGASANYLLINDERRPSAREMLRIQGFPDTFKIVVNYGQIKHQTGNSVAVPVMKAVAREVVKSMQKAGMLNNG